MTAFRHSSLCLVISKSQLHIIRNVILPFCQNAACRYPRYREFYNAETDDIIDLHKPHPGTEISDLIQDISDARNIRVPVFI